MAAPLNEGDYRQLAHVVNGVANVVIPVLYPIQTILGAMNVISLAPPGSRADTFATGAAISSQLCQGNTAIRGADINVNDDLNAATTLLIMDFTTQQGRSLAMDFYFQLQTRTVPFPPGTRFAIVIFGLDDPTLVNAIDDTPGATLVIGPDDIPALDDTTLSNATDDIFGLLDPILTDSTEIFPGLDDDQILSNTTNDFPNDDSDIVKAVRDMFLQLGAQQMIASRYINIQDQPSEVAAVQQWLKDVDTELERIWHASAIQQQALVIQADNPTEAFIVFSEQQFVPIELKSERFVTGHLFQGFVVRREGNFFLAPPEEEVEIIAIKRKRIDVVNFLLGHGHQENPWREIYRLQTLGDGIHVPVIGPNRALSDGRYLYQITKWANGGSLDQIVQEQLPLPLHVARDFFQQMLIILLYIHQQGICHHDIKPSNFLVHDGRLLLSDFAMSMRMPPGRRVVHPPHVRFGTFAFMLPEHYRGEMYDATHFDLWAVACCLFVLVTGVPYLYECPSEENLLYAYTIQAGLLSSNPNVNDVLSVENWIVSRINEALVQFDLVNLMFWEEIQEDLFHLKQKITQLPQEVLEVFDHTLTIIPHMRWTVEQIMGLLWLR